MLTEERAEDFLEGVTGDATLVPLRVIEDVESLIVRIDVTIPAIKETGVGAEVSWEGTTEKPGTILESDLEVQRDVPLRMKGAVHTSRNHISQPKSG